MKDDTVTGDLHIIDDEGSCWCEPEKIEEEDGVVWVHHDREEWN